MHGTMVRFVAVLVVGALVGWGLFFVTLEDKPLAVHLAEVWQSPAVQSKVQLIRRAAPDIAAQATGALNDGWARLREVDLPTRTRAARKADINRQPSNSDRASLDALVQEVDREPQSK